MAEKKCRRCRQTFADSSMEFRYVPSRNDYHHTCRVCEAEEKVAYYQAKAQEYRDRRQRRIDERRITHEIFESIRRREQCTANHS